MGVCRLRALVLSFDWLDFPSGSATRIECMYSTPSDDLVWIKLLNPTISPWFFCRIPVTNREHFRSSGFPQTVAPSGRWWKKWQRRCNRVAEPNSDGMLISSSLLWLLLHSILSDDEWRLRWIIVMLCRFGSLMIATRIWNLRNILNKAIFR